MKTSILFGAAALIAAAILWGPFPALAQESAPKGQAPLPQVGIVELTPQAVSLTTTLAGRTSPYLIAEVRPQVGGIIQKRLFTEGADVKAGDTLYQIDPATYQAAFDSAKAALARSEANAIPAKLRAERYTQLVTVNAVSRQDYDDAVALDKQAEALVEVDKAALATARINLGYTRVTSPISGRIGRSAVTPGALVTASQGTALSTVQQLDPIYVDVTQSSAELLRLKRDLAEGRLRSAGENQAVVKLLLEDGTPYPREGRLEFSDVTVDQSTGAITLRAVFPNPSAELLPGMFVRAVLEEGVSEQAILAPQQGVTRNFKGEATALVLAPDGTVEQRIVQVDRAMGDKWLVRSGLNAGDRLIVDGLQKVRPGMKAQPAPTASTPAPAATPASATPADK
ncbi:efflux RND transporter periplasmic adaptor subunit [Desulfovibrio aminophilus]|uniref:efflux RND transporter periplasmic adaptor subunit n=1 Tax=Desulfovibrio aminophilus TaxID=81425 RepID=UPI00339A170B